MAIISIEPGHLIAEFDKNGHLVFRGPIQEEITTIPTWVHVLTPVSPGDLKDQREKNYLRFQYRTHKISSEQYEQQLARLNGTKFIPSDPAQPPAPKPSKKTDNFSIILYNKEDDVSVVVHCIDKDKPIYTRHRINFEELGENYQGGVKREAKFTNKINYKIYPKSASHDWEYIFFSDEEAYKVCKNIEASKYYNIKFGDKEKSYHCNAVQRYK